MPPEPQGIRVRISSGIQLGVVGVDRAIAGNLVVPGRQFVALVIGRGEEP